MSQTTKKLYIPNSYHAYECATEVDSIVKPMFGNNAISFFDYARIYFDGSWLFLTNSVNVSQYLFDTGFAFLPHVDIKKQHSFHLLSSNKQFSASLAALKKNMGLKNVFQYVIKNERYVDIYGFATRREHDDMTDFYLNNLDFIQNYAYQFQDQASELIKQSEKNKIVIPEVLTDDYNDAFQRIQAIKNQNDKLPHFHNQSIYIHGERVKFTRREMDCIQLITKGFTAKMIAKSLSLSHRTVESYLEKLKRKCDCESRMQLVELFLRA